MDRAYREFDKEGKGEFTYGELAEKLIGVGAAFERGTLISLAEDIDTDNDGRISKVSVTSASCSRDLLLLLSGRIIMLQRRVVSLPQDRGLDDESLSKETGSAGVCITRESCH